MNIYGSFMDIFDQKHLWTFLTQKHLWPFMTKTQREAQI